MSATRAKAGLQPQVGPVRHDPTRRLCRDVGVITEERRCERECRIQRRREPAIVSRRIRQRGRQLRRRKRQCTGARFSGEAVAVQMIEWVVVSIEQSDSQEPGTVIG